MFTGSAAFSSAATNSFAVHCVCLDWASADCANQAGASCHCCKITMKLIEVAAGLIFHDGRLLITQRYPEAHLGGLWEFPGGKREANERSADCLKRRLREALSIEI